MWHRGAGGPSVCCTLLPVSDLWSSTPVAPTAPRAVWDNLEVAVREGSPMVRADTVDGAASFYPDVVGNLGTMLAAVAPRAAFLLPAATHVLDQARELRHGASPTPSVTRAAL
jgi:hypothetical protein